MNTILNRLCLAMSLLLSNSLAYAETNAASAPEDRWYQVEVIIFAQQDNFGDEHPSTKTLRYPEALLDITSPDSPFPLVNKDEWQLGPDAYTLNRSQRYRVLYHQAWRQAGRTPAGASWIKILGGKPIDQHYELEGSLRVYKTRFLHLETNLWRIVSDSADSAPVTYDNLAIETDRQATVQPTVGAPKQNLITLPPIPGSSDREIIQTTLSGRVYTLQASQQLSSGELHYVDHPNLGILIRVDRSSPL